MAESVVISKSTDVVNVSITTSGEVNTALSVGTGAQIFKEKVGADLRFRSVIGGTGITVTQNANDVTIDRDALTTTDVTEGTNLYYTDGRFDTRLATKSTTDVSEGTNLYYTTARANSDFDTRLAIKSTTDVSEGTNLYYTDTRFDNRLATKTTSDVAEGTNLYYTDARVSSHLLTMDGSIIPDTDITHDLGSPTKQWRDVYIGPGSLYVNNKKVIEDDSGTITIETDADQNLRVKTTGTGVTQISSAGAVQITSTGSADIELATSTGQIELNGDVVIDVTKSLSTSTGGTLAVNAPLNLGSNALTAGNVIITGDLTVSGTTTTISTEELLVADNTIVLNSNYTGSSPSENAGIEIERGTETNKTFIWDETSDRWTIGAETFVAGTVIANLTGNVTGEVSTLSNHDTGDLTEGTNLYYTDARARAAISATGDLSYNSTTGVMSFTERTDAEVRGLISATGDLSYNSTTGVMSFTTPSIPADISDLTDTTNLLNNDDLSNNTTSDLAEGTNLYYTDTRANSAIDVRVTKSFVENLDIDVDGGTY